MIFFLLKISRLKPTVYRKEKQEKMTTLLEKRKQKMKDWEERFFAKHNRMATFEDLENYPRVSKSTAKQPLILRTIISRDQDFESKKGSTLGTRGK